MQPYPNGKYLSEVSETLCDLLENNSVPDKNAWMPRLIWIYGLRLTFIEHSSNYLLELKIRGILTLFDLQNLCDWYSKESAQRDNFFDYPQHRF